MNLKTAELFSVSSRVYVDQYIANIEEVHQRKGELHRFQSSNLIMKFTKTYNFFSASCFCLGVLKKVFIVVLGFSMGAGVVPLPLGLLVAGYFRAISLVVK
jgi:hypothetical protein